jgi:hypothetical protein
MKNMYFLKTYNFLMVDTVCILLFISFSIKWWITWIPVSGLVTDAATGALPAANVVIKPVQL